MRRWVLWAIAIAGAWLLAGAGPAGAADRSDFVRSFDGTQLNTHFFVGEGASRAQRAPTVLIGHGWGSSGASSRDAASIAPFLKAGYNVLTWDARGFGQSGGTVMIDHPEYEGRDVSSLLDYVARRPEAERQRKGDPVAGMTGPSYAGGVEWIAAAQDHRIDAIAPVISWNSLLSSLYKRGAVKLGWGSALVGLGVPTATFGGVFSPVGPEFGGQSPHFYNLLVGGATTGSFPAAEVAWLREHGPDFLLRRVRAPTMIVQGEPDTLFTLAEAVRNFRALRRTGTPVKMLWFCGGHGVCLTKSDTSGGSFENALTGDAGKALTRRLAWFDRYLKGKRRVRTGPRFQWIDEEGRYHRSSGYPPRPVGQLTGTGAGKLPLTPGATGGALVLATPSPLGLNVSLEKPRPGAQIVGPPKLTLRYSATGTSTYAAHPKKTFVYAQVVDRKRHIVVNNQATPIPIRLDGKTHRLSLRLETLASVATAEGYQLQLIPQTTLYDFQRAAGLVDVKHARIALPVTEPR